MSLHILDTDIMTLYQHGHPRVVHNVLAHPAAQLAIAVISVEEELTGWYTKLRQARKRDQIARVYQRLASAVPFFARFQILSFTEAAIMRYESLRAVHRNVGKNDLRISAIALENGATVVTRNLRDFKHIAGLAIEDWAK
ncbi:MAG TPA: type II toxin-antitoxin system VapC family toxin [Gemmataceae bacterium]|nr:type II toxin-antitoxin system VapC family toxin [Gemmataceae bacterium]